ncbi:MAG: KTSC domain-containing protein [Desulfobacteraceae bacterium]|nr:KTSC domain-containing protein [Desulfobacteraceae bacterium]
MKMKPVTSSHVTAIGHDGNNTMEVHFKGDRKYKYENVSAEDFAVIDASDSTGIALRQLGATGTLMAEDEQ